MPKTKDKLQKEIRKVLRKARKAKTEKLSEMSVRRRRALRKARTIYAEWLREQGREEYEIKKILKKVPVLTIQYKQYTKKKLYENVKFSKNKVYLYNKKKWISYAAFEMYKKRLDYVAKVRATQTLYGLTYYEAQIYLRYFRTKITKLEKRKRQLKMMKKTKIIEEKIEKIQNEIIRLRSEIAEVGTP